MPKRKVGCRRAVAMIAVGGVAAILSGCATSHGTNGVPDLRGTWTRTEGQLLFWNGNMNDYAEDYDLATIEITDQTGAVFNVTNTVHYKSDADAGYQGDKRITRAPEAMLGVVGWDGR